ncbi:MAG: PKD domain-containing protein, partial [Cytophagales bacterium]|nr:PKD domain-containing protein [Cytophagales bacterium]
MKLTTYTFKLIIFSVLLIPTVTNAQYRNSNWCGTDEEVNKSLSNNHDLIKKRKELEYFTQNYITSNKKKPGHTLYVIPIVFHIIHNYGSENISKEQVENAVRIINEDFKKLNPDSIDVVPPFDIIAADCGIEFRLAKKDPSGNCTQGITRTLSDLTYDAGENVKDLISWNTQKYFNVWVVANIASGAGAYAYYPCSAPSLSHEGVVNRYTQLGGGRTLTHETGHYFNLAHTWGSTNDPGLSTNCSIDDGVTDTPNTIGTFGCNLSGTSCASLDNVQNYMDYASCSKMFTEGQKTRMLAAITGSPCRNNLWTNSNLIATGTNDGYTAPPCVPIAEFSNNFNEGCEGLTVLFYDKSYDADVDSTWTWSWNFPGGNPATSNLQNPSVTYNTFGVYDATLTVSNSTGSDALTRTGIVTVKPITGEVTPLLEGIENLTFPAHPTDAKKDWDVVNPGGATWERTTTAFFSGAASARIR